VVTPLGRRAFLRVAGVSGAALAIQTAWVPRAVAGTPRATDGPYGPLAGEPDTNGLLLPEGFTARVVATTRQPVPGTDYEWHVFPDGGATYPTDDGGWIYVSNSEVPNRSGGASAIRFDADGEIVAAYRILGETSSNCAGGPTPWGTWLSCEEFDLHGADPAVIADTGSIAGRVWECDPSGEADAVVWAALGVFSHEAVAVDPVGERLYLTEDQGNGLLYRFTPDSYPDLAAGTLEVARVEEGTVTWLPLPDPTATDTPTREQVPDATPFAGGEGIWWHEGVLTFTTKGTDQVHAIETAADTYEVLYDAADLGEGAPLTGVDNVVVEEGSGDLYVAEDGGDMQLVVLTPEGEVAPFLQVLGHDGSEMTGPAFSPDGSRLYFSSQRGKGDGQMIGLTFEVTGPFRGIEARASASTTTAPPSAPTTLREAAEQATGSAAGGSGDDDGVPVPLLVGGGVVVAGAAAAGVVALRRRGATST